MTRWHAFVIARAAVIALAIFAAGIQLVHQGTEIQKLRNEVVQLNEACIPANTGGGVVQCLQPNARQTGSVAR